MRTALCVSLALIVTTTVTAAEPVSKLTLAVSIDFPGGSAEVQEVNQQSRLVKIVPTQHKDRGWICWWYFKLTGCEPGETITLDVGEGVWATPNRASFSYDNRTWQHTEPGMRVGKRIVFTIKFEAAEVWLAWGPPFVPADAAAQVTEAAKKSPYVQSFELCRTLEGRPVPAMRISQPNPENLEKYGIWIHARQHAWESGSCWVCRGLVEWLVSDDPRAESLRKSADFVIVPIMDIDNVAVGAGGKEQKPQDHNRDWSDKPHFPAVQAAQREIAKMNGSKHFDMFIDLHNPGPSDRNPYYYAAPKENLSARGKRNLDEFVAITRLEMTGPLTYLGKVLESGANYDKAWKQISKNWVTTHTRDHVVAVTLETAWNTPNSTQAGYMQVGRELGLSMERYLRSNPRRE
jgi:hypothetical protein